MSTILGALRYALCHDESQRRTDTESVGRAVLCPPLFARVLWRGNAVRALQIENFREKAFFRVGLQVRVRSVLCVCSTISASARFSMGHLTQIATNCWHWCLNM